MKSRFTPFCVRSIAISLLVLCLSLALGYLFRVQLLTSLANVWVVNDTLGRSDAIVILAGCAESRPACAAKLYNAGLAPRILYTDVKIVSGKPQSQEIKEFLKTAGIPESVCTVIGRQAANTWDESQLVRDWVQRNNAHSVIIVTDIFHTRRARWLFVKQLAPIHVNVEIAAAINPAYQESNWWHFKDGIKSFEHEFCGLFYYWLKY